MIGEKSYQALAMLLAWTLVLSFGMVASTPPILDEELLTKIANEVSGSICFEHIRFMSTLHRMWGSRDYHRAAQYFVDKSILYGLSGAEIETYPIKTGRESFWMHSTGGNVPWDLKRGEFRLIEPYPMLLTHSENAPSTIAPGSRSTDTQAELVYVGRGDTAEDYEGKRIQGKIVLAEEGRHERVHELAVHRFGALGTVQYYNQQGRYWEAEGIYWAGVRPWSEDGRKPSTFGINISTNQGLFLKDLLEKGEKVVVSARIDADVVENGVYELATAVIPGSDFPDEEFIFYAHLDHPKPGAHDNASGDAVLLEIARTLSSLIRQKVLLPPKRTIRFMWIPHMSGLNMYFFHHQEKIGKVKGGCNIDCVGSDPAKFPAQFYVALPPHSLPSCLADITRNLTDYVNQKFSSKSDWLVAPEGSRNVFSVVVMPYQGASDEYTANTRSLNIPSIYFYDDPLPPRHNQINFLSYMDRTNLGRIAFLGTAISYAFASVDQTTEPRMINEVEYRGKARLEKEFLQGKNLINSSTGEDVHRSYAEAKNLLDWGIKREKGMIGSVNAVCSGEEVLYADCIQVLESSAQDCFDGLRATYDRKCRSLNIHSLKGVPLKKSYPSWWLKTVPVQNPTIKGSIGYFSNYFEDMLGKDFLSKYQGVKSSIHYGHVGYYETLNYIDGQNSIADIYQAVQAELLSGGYSSYHQMSFEEMSNFMRLLKDGRVIDY
jgi:aminopeptidase YwaD